MNNNIILVVLCLMLGMVFSMTTMIGKIHKDVDYIAYRMQP